jgi:hypothetical protein
MHHTVVNTFIYSVAIVLNFLHFIPYNKRYYWALLPSFGVYECPSGQTGFIGKLKQLQSVG